MASNETKYLIGFMEGIMDKNKYTERYIHEEFVRNILWYDNAGFPPESPIKKVCYDGICISLILDTGFGTVTVYEEDPAFSDVEAMEAVFDSLMEYTGNGTRKCSECGKRMISGCYDYPDNYYCSVACWRKRYTDEQWKKECQTGLTEEEIEDGQTCGDYAYETDFYY